MTGAEIHRFTSYRNTVIKLLLGNIDDCGTALTVYLTVEYTAGYGKISPVANGCSELVRYMRVFRNNRTGSKYLEP
jgi:hypothetical protein